MVLLSPQHPAMQGSNVNNTQAALCECADFGRAHHGGASVISLRGRWRCGGVVEVNAVRVTARAGTSMGALASRACQGPTHHRLLFAARATRTRPVRVEVAEPCSGVPSFLPTFLRYLRTIGRTTSGRTDTASEDEQLHAVHFGDPTRAREALNRLAAPPLI